MKTAVRMMTTVSLLTFLASCGGGGAGSVSGGSTSYGATVNGRFIDAPVQGLQYYRASETSDGLAADDVRITGANGGFVCSSGETVTFSLNAINGVDLGTITCGAEEVFPNDLNTVNGDSRKAQMVALLLHHMSNDFDGTNLIPSSSTIIIASSAITFMASYDIDLGNEEDIIVTISDLRANRGLGALDRSNNDQQFENLLLAAQAHLEESVEVVEETHRLAAQSEVLKFIRDNGQVTQANFDSSCYTWNNSAVAGAIYGMVVIGNEKFVRIPQDSTTFCSIDSAPQVEWTGVPAVDAEYDILLAINSIVNQNNSITVQWDSNMITNNSATFHAKVSGGNYDVTGADQVAGVKNDSGRFIKVNNEIRYYYSCSNLDATDHPMLDTYCGMDANGLSNAELEELNNY